MLVCMNRFVHLGFYTPNVLPYLVVYALKVYRTFRPLFADEGTFLFKSTTERVRPVRVLTEAVLNIPSRSRRPVNEIS